MAGGAEVAALAQVPGFAVARATPAWGLDAQDIPLEAGPDEALVVPGRGLLHEPAAARLNHTDFSEASLGMNTAVTPLVTTLPDGSTGTAWRIAMPAAGGTFANLTGALPLTVHTIQVWVRDAQAGAPDFALGAGGSPEQLTAGSGWTRFAVTQMSAGQAATLNNRFDTFATDVIAVWPDVQEGGPGSPILAPGATATRAAASISIAGLTALNGITAGHVFTATFEDGSTAPLAASGGTLTFPAAALAYRSIIG